MISERKFSYYYNELFLKEYSYPPDQLQKEFGLWISKFGDTQRSRSDFIWSMFNTFLNRLGKKAQSKHDLYTYQRKIHLDMLQFRIDEGKKGKNLDSLRMVINLIDLHLATLSAFEIEVTISIPTANCILLT